MSETTSKIARDISWLHFNHRVLQEAANPEVPLYERIKFLAIYSSNLDEFFRVRVAALRSYRKLRKKTRKELDIKPKKQLKQIRQIVRSQQEMFGEIFQENILPELAEHGIELLKPDEYNAEQQKFAHQYFYEKVYPLLQNLELESSSKKAPFLLNKALYLIVTFPDSHDLSIVNIPSDKLPRFIKMPGSEAGHHPITFLDDIIRNHLENYLEREVSGVYAIKVSRDAEIYIDDEFSGDLVEKIQAGLKERQVGLPTRFLYDSRMPEDLVARIKELFNLSKNDLIPGARYHNFNDFFAFPDPVGHPELHYESLPPLPHPTLEKADSILSLIAKKDQMLHFPYQRFDYVHRMIAEAAADPQVKAIKVTLYRVANQSKVVQALLAALEAGKEVMAFIEAKARFDEASNLHWGKELEKAGAKVQYSYPGIKVHTKLLLIQREEGDDIRNYAYLGTGNFNEKTARIYCDHALLTADKKLGKEVSKIFKVLEGEIIVPKTKHLLVAPFYLRDRLIDMIDNEIELAKAGKPAYMILKMNSLEEQGMIDKLLEASEAGVKIQMIVRGICCLLPGPDSNIEIISIVDRFLEHSRVLIFGNGGDEKIYTASADWMNRNLYNRIEVAIPIYDPDIRQELREIIDIQLADNCKARKIDPDQCNTFRTGPDGSSVNRAQLDIYNYLKQQVEIEEPEVRA
ncbi:polyphosphate kinase 1 [Flavilitoribacter nigricans]|uniref:Polyphosphate kinase n=1 Tax=Flavilitoribacter nigricans (strain ATCC 23147 / DSM 23189 / NBRC 102662 / NCIMB 1420 / SS-2) TaxID=1122177 RepID=A0A2D0NBQ8_FLAN2|nr:polyphosphate kinase 1 [Flavilitoribacter nigricans]PHN05818.1 polyphosphate kinase 1 [Flavilitoribacter nigricans DSM 23189 = NBRC 102662]